MIICEGNVKEIFNIEKISSLSKRLEVAINNLDKDTQILRTTKIPKVWKDMSVDTYKTLIKELWSLKESARSLLVKLKYREWDPNKFKNEIPLCHKILSIWSGNKGDVYHRLIEMNKVVDDYNKRFPNNPLSHVDELIGIEIRPSVKTEEINYFPY